MAVYMCAYFQHLLLDYVKVPLQRCHDNVTLIGTCLTLTTIGAFVETKRCRYTSNTGTEAPCLKLTCTKFAHSMKKVTVYCSGMYYRKKALITITKTTCPTNLALWYCLISSSSVRSCFDRFSSSATSSTDHGLCICSGASSSNWSSSIDGAAKPRSLRISSSLSTNPSQYFASCRIQQLAAITSKAQV